MFIKLASITHTVNVILTGNMMCHVMIYTLVGKVLSEWYHE